VTPESIAGVSEYTVSVATGALRLWTLQAGNGDLYLLFMEGLAVVLWNWVVLSNVCLMMSGGAKMKCG
jgi:hypothetical protein